MSEVVDLLAWKRLDEIRALEAGVAAATAEIEQLRIAVQECHALADARGME